jgi:hypothetical protein
MFMLMEVIPFPMDSVPLKLVKKLDVLSVNVLDVLQDVLNVSKLLINVLVVHLL